MSRRLYCFIAGCWCGQTEPFGCLSVGQLLALLSVVLFSLSHSALLFGLDGAREPEFIIESAETLLLFNGHNSTQLSDILA